MTSPLSVPNSLPPPLPLVSPLTGTSLAETLDGGQCFRWNRSGPQTWSGVSGTCSAELVETDAGLEPHLRAGSIDVLQEHLAAKVNWDELADRLPWRTDAHIERCRRAFPGLRILRQPIGEALLCFLCSPTKQIVQIKQMVELLAVRFGTKLTKGCHALPTWAELADVSESQLRLCKLGFRARHIRAVAVFLAHRKEWLEETAALPYPLARAQLMTLSGVGEKVADCVLLFGAGKLEAFPVDVWILRAMQRHYALTNLSLPQVAQFGRAHFGPLAGLAQQFLFAWERRQ